MRQQGSAWIVIVSLVLSGVPVWAQETSTASETIPVLCYDWKQGAQQVELTMTRDQWDRLSRDQQIAACEVEMKKTARLPDAPKSYKYKTGEMVSFKVGATGVFMALAGVIMMLPQGDEYDILGDSYCVHTYSVDYGGCGFGPTVKQWGAILFGSGVLLGYLGLRSKIVTVNPVITAHTKGASATIKFGGSHGHK